MTAEIETRSRTNVVTVPIQCVTTRLPKEAGKGKGGSTNAVETAASTFQRFLDSPQRVVIEFTPDDKLGFDASLMWARSPEVVRTDNR